VTTEEHRVVLEITYLSEPGWEAINKIAMQIGEDVLTRWDAVIDVEGSVDPEVTEGRVYVRKEL